MTSKRLVAAILVSGVVIAGATVVWARQESAQAALADGSLAGLTAEVRALRLALEMAAKDQQQAQGLAVYMTLQKDRLLQVVARLDTARRETRNAVEQTRNTANELAGAERYLADPDLPADQRANVERIVRANKASLEAAQRSESEARSRESLAEQAVATEEARWNELVARLELSIRR